MNPISDPKFTNMMSDIKATLKKIDLKAKTNDMYSKTGKHIGALHHIFRHKDQILFEKINPIDRKQIINRLPTRHKKVHYIASYFKIYFDFLQTTHEEGEFQK